MPYSEIVLAPGSNRPISLTLADALGQPLDFSVGTWRAYLDITDYPMSESLPLATIATDNVGGALSWLTLSGTKIILTPVGSITRTWKWQRKHYDLYLKGPAVGSSYDRLDHGPFKIDW